MYYSNGELFYEGEFYQDKPNGNSVKVKNANGGVSYIGDYHLGNKFG